MVTSVGTTTTTSATNTTSAADAAMKQATGFSESDFLNLFVAQLQNQDPLSPQDPGQMINQLAQITQVEQSYNTNTALQSLLAAQNNASASSYLGMTVAASGNSVSFDGTNPTTLQFNLSGATASSTVTISDASGNIVKTATLGAQSGGNASFTWDGKNDSGATLPAGAYTFAVTGTTSAGASVSATTYTSGVVNGVSFNNGTPSLTIGSTSVPLSSVVSVGG